MVFFSNVEKWGPRAAKLVVEHAETYAVVECAEGWGAIPEKNKNTGKV